MEFLEKLLQEFFHDKILQELFSEFFQKLLQGFLQKFYFRCSSDALHVSGENPLGGASKSLCHKLLQQYLRKLLQQFFGKFIQEFLHVFRSSRNLDTLAYGITSGFFSQISSGTSTNSPSTNIFFSLKFLHKYLIRLITLTQIPSKLSSTGIFIFIILIPSGISFAINVAGIPPLCHLGFL